MGRTAGLDTDAPYMILMVKQGNHRLGCYPVKPWCYPFILRERCRRPLPTTWLLACGFRPIRLLHHAAVTRLHSRGLPVSDRACFRPLPLREVSHNEQSLRVTCRRSNLGQSWRPRLLDACLGRRERQGFFWR